MALITHFSSRVCVEEYLQRNGFLPVTGRTWLHNDCETFAVVRQLNAGGYHVHYCA